MALGFGQNCGNSQSDGNYILTCIGRDEDSKVDIQR